MTNKKKKRAKSISKKSGMSHAAAMNHLNNLLVKTEQIQTGPITEGVHNFRRRPTRPEDVADMDRELQEALGAPGGELEVGPDVWGAQVPPLRGTPEYESLSYAFGRGGYEGDPRMDPNLGINKDPLNDRLRDERTRSGRFQTSTTGEWRMLPHLENPLPLEVKWVPLEERFKRPAPIPSKNIRPASPKPKYKGYNWIYLKNVREEDYALFCEKPPWWVVDEPGSNITDESWNKSYFTSAPTLSIVGVASFIHTAVSTEVELVPLVFTNRRLNKEGKSPVVIRSVRREDLHRFRDRLEKPPKWLREVAAPRVKEDPGFPRSGPGRRGV